MENIILDITCLNHQLSLEQLRQHHSQVVHRLQVLLCTPYTPFHPPDLGMRGEGGSPPEAGADSPLK